MSFGLRPTAAVSKGVDAAPGNSGVPAMVTGLAIRISSGNKGFMHSPIVRAQCIRAGSSLSVQAARAEAKLRQTELPRSCIWGALIGARAQSLGIAAGETKSSVGV